MIDVTFVHRKPQLGNFSLEGLFADIRGALPSDICSSVWECPFVSRGFLPRLWNIMTAAWNQGQVTHITGDVSYVSLLMRRRSTVLTIPDVVLLHRTTGFRRAIVRQVWFRLPSLSAACVIAISESVRKELIADVGCEPDRVFAIHVPLNPRFVPDCRPIRKRRARVLMIGSAWNKNLRRQTEALAGLPVEVDFVGLLNDEHREAFAKSGIAFTHSYGLSDTEMLARYRHCDLVLFASTYEGFGMPIAEAQAVGRPVITGSTHSMPEVAGGAACLVDAFSVESIRAGVRRVLEDEEYRAALIDAGFLNVRRFNPVRIAAEHAEVYRRIVAESA